MNLSKVGTTGLLVANLTLKVFLKRCFYKCSGNTLLNLFGLSLNVGKTLNCEFLNQPVPSYFRHGTILWGVVLKPFSPPPPPFPLFPWKFILGPSSSSSSFLFSSSQRAPPILSNFFFSLTFSSSSLLLTSLQYHSSTEEENPETSRDQTLNSH